MATVLPNAAAFKKLKETRFKNDPDKKIAGELGITIPTWKNLVEGRPVQPRTIKKVVEKSGVRFDKLVLPAHPRELPGDPAFYESLGNSYFIDHARTPEEQKAQWHPEIIQLQRAAGSDAKWVWFTGWINNQKNGDFEVRACLIRHKPFTIMAARNDRADAFVATFSHMVSTGGASPKQVLCGIWIGEDLLSRLAVYRMFCSKKGEPLDSAEISLLLHQNPIITKFEDDATAVLPKHMAVKRPVLLKQGGTGAPSNKQTMR